jgi:hypothetical protein
MIPLGAFEFCIPHISSFEKGFMEGEGGSEGLRGVAVLREFEISPEQISIGGIHTIVDDRECAFTRVFGTEIRDPVLGD